MDRFQEMTVFEAVADELSLAAAARRLYLSPPTVTRAIDALEQRLGDVDVPAGRRQVRPERRALAIAATVGAWAGSRGCRGGSSGVQKKDDLIL